jgi:hypothetical protein
MVAPIWPASVSTTMVPSPRRDGVAGSPMPRSAIVMSSAQSLISRLSDASPDSPGE